MNQTTTPPLDEFFPHVFDVSAERVARVYAQALLDAAEKRGEAQSLLDEIEDLQKNLINVRPLVREFITTSAIGRKIKGEVLVKALEGRVSELLFNFLMVLNRHERLELFRQVVHLYREMFDQRARRMRVQVRSAVPLEADQRERILSGLQNYFQLEPVLEERLEPEMLGGMIVRVGDWVFDSSVRTRLETLRTQLLAESSHAIQSRRDRFSSAE
jgi:F-type H+-transporting ATPase subunit delta